MNELSFLDSLFNDVMDAASKSSVYYHTSAFAPRVDVKEEENSYTLEMELPGRCENDVSIELDHDNLTIASKVEETKERIPMEIIGEKSMFPKIAVIMSFFVIIPQFEPDSDVLLPSEKLKLKK